MRSKLLLAVLFCIPVWYSAFAAAGPAITSFTPASGAPGTLVTITGTNLGSPTAINIGGKAALAISNTATQVVGFVMPGAATGVVSITTAGGTVNSSSNFTVTATPYPSQQEGNPIITATNYGQAEIGTSVAISADGTTALVGGPFYYSGSGISPGVALVFVYSGGMWTQQAEFSASNFSPQQGRSVALSADGNTAMVGGSGDDSTTVDGTSTGAVWFYTRVGTVWREEGKPLIGTGYIPYPGQGSSCALSADGNTAIEGGYGDNGGIGAAWIFTRSNGVWTQEGPKLVPADNTGNANFASSVAISADGNTAVMGGYNDNTSVNSHNQEMVPGATWVFTRTGSTWSQQGGKLVATGGSGNDQQGTAVGVSADGNTMVTSGPGSNSVWIFTRNGATWSQLGSALPETGVTGNPGNGIQAGFGSGVALSADGNTVVVGDSQNGSFDGPGPGGTWVFTRSGNTYVQQEGALMGTGTGTTAYPSQGEAVALSPNGTAFVTGGPVNGTNYQGAAWVFSAVIPPATITAGAVTGSISACAGSASISPFVQQFTVSGTALTANVSATAPAGFEVSLAANNGYGSSVMLIPSGGLVNSAVYVRSAAGDAPGVISGNVALTSTGATTQNVAVTGTVNALPTVSAVSNQTLVNGAATAPVNFTGTANSFTWTNDTPGIGLAASGNGNIATFNAVNSGSSPVTATITVAPVNAGQVYLANTANGNVTVVNTLTDSTAATVQGGGQEPVGVSVSPDGSKVYVANTSSNNISVISTLTNSLTASIPVGNNVTPHGVAVSPDGSKLYVTGYNASEVLVISTSTDAITATIGVGQSPFGIALSPDGTKAYVTNYYPGTVSVINTQTNTVTATVTVGSGPKGICVSPDGNTVYVANQGGTVSVISANTNTIVATISVGVFTFGIAISPDGSRVYAANNASGTVSVINTQTNTVVATIQVGQSPGGLSFSPDGSRLYVENGSLVVINTATNAIANTISFPFGVGTASFGNFVTAGVNCTGEPVKFTITVNPTPVAPAVITFPAPVAVTYGSADVAPGATSTNTSIPITYTSSDAAVATIVNGNIHIVGAGTTQITASQAGNATYSPATPVTQPFTVNPAPLTITANNQTWPYAGTEPVLTVTYTTLVNGDTPASLTTQPTVSTTATATSALGSYPITVSGAVDPNYTVTYVAGTLQVIGGVPTATTLAATGLGAAGATLNGTVNDDGTATTVNIVYSTAPDLSTNPMTVQLSTNSSGTSSVNYNTVVTGLTAGTTYYFRIEAVYYTGTVYGDILSFTTPSLQAQTITFSLQGATYGSPDVTPGATSTNATIPITYTSSNTAVATITGAGNIHIVGAGTTIVTASQAGNSTYSPATPVTQNFTVTPATLTVTAHNETKVYGSANPNLVYQYSGFVNGDDSTKLSPQATVSTTAASATGVGSYPITLAGAADPNYTISYVGATLTITPAALTITANNQTKVQGTANPALTASYTGFANNDTADDLSSQPVLATTATVSSEVGAYPITVSGAVDPNYNITYVPGTLTITPPLVFNPIPAKTYGDPDFNPGATGTNVTYSSGNTALATITDGGDVHIVGAGSVTITATSGGSSLSQTVVINPAPLSITANDQTRTYGAVNPALTLTYTGFVYSDNAASLTTAPVGTTTATAGSDVGTYPITVSGAADPNYTITYVPGNLSVTPAALTITADNQTKALGAPIPVLTVTYTGFVNNNTADDLSASPVVETTAVTSSDPGTYPITVSGAVDPNYTITYVGGTLTILPPPTLIANNILTPNGDGVNDVWVVHDIQFYPDNTVTIYDRAGRQVYSKRGYNNDWAGTADGKPLAEGTYYYVLVLKPDLPYIKGFISIIRSK